MDIRSQIEELYNEYKDKTTYGEIGEYQREGALEVLQRIKDLYEG